MKCMYVLHQSSSNMQVSQNFSSPWWVLNRLKEKKKKKEQRETNDRVSLNIAKYWSYLFPLLLDW